MLKLVVIGAMITALAQPGLSDNPAAAPTTSPLAVDVVAVAGSGCPPGTAEVSIDPDSRTFVVTFDSYVAEVGPTSPAGSQRRNCLLSLSARPPQGFTYAIASTSYRGRASIAAGAGARYGATYFVAGQVSQVVRSHVVAGPFDGPVQLSDVIAPDQQLWAPCGVQRNINVNTEVRVLPGTSDTRQTTSLATVEQAYGFTFALRSCA